MPNTQRGRSIASGQALKDANRKRHIDAIIAKLEKLTPEERQKVLQRLQDKETE
jgi:hypothetical protein